MAQARRTSPLATLLAGTLLLGASALQAASDVRVVGLFPNAAVVNIDGARHMLRVGKPAVQGVELVAPASSACNANTLKASPRPNGSR